MAEKCAKFLQQNKCNTTLALAQWVAHYILEDHLGLDDVAADREGLVEEGRLVSEHPVNVGTVTRQNTGGVLFHPSQLSVVRLRYFPELNISKNSIRGAQGSPQLLSRQSEPG